MKNKKEKTLVKTGVGIAVRDKELALEGINEFIRLSIAELEMDRIADEAEFHDYCMHQAGDPSY